jgi:hypothetical protein
MQFIIFSKYFKWVILPLRVQHLSFAPKITEILLKIKIIKKRKPKNLDQNIKNSIFYFIFCYLMPCFYYYYFFSKGGGEYLKLMCESWRPQEIAQSAVSHAL